MKPTLIFPTILIALDIGAAIVYAVCGDLKRCGRWFCGNELDEDGLCDDCATEAAIERKEEGEDESEDKR